MRALVVTALVGCGRVGFDPVGDALPDIANLPAACGDGVCAGRDGELCSTCASDCATLADVCGNGECSDGESTCYADCGPSPWPWQTDSAAMLTAINQARANGTICPGSTATQTAPALAYDPALEPAAREWAWEAAHEDWAASDSCNGRAGVDRVVAAGATSAWKAFGSASGTDAIAALLAFQPACDEMMKASNTQFAAAAAYDLITAHAIMLR
ncbi:MAG TPA: CAP domain-containing protein [Kofleriaceae bacterium]